MIDLQAQRVISEKCEIDESSLYFTFSMGRMGEFCAFSESFISPEDDLFVTGAGWNGPQKQQQRCVYFSRGMICVCE